MTEQQTVRTDRLLELARFLKEDLSKKPTLFDFKVVMNAGELPPLEAYEQGGGCGTAGCAMGWLPKVFPNHWEWYKEKEYDNFFQLVYKDNRMAPWLTGIKNFFGIGNDEYYLLFETEPRGGILPAYSTPNMVAENIESYVRGVESNA